jgi:hypothetical protein
VATGVAARAADGTVTATAESDVDGKFRLELPAGDYTLVTADAGPRCDPKAVAVVAGGSIDVVLSCASGLQ